MKKGDFMKKILILGAQLNGNDAVSNIIRSLIINYNSNYSFCLLSYGLKNEIFKYDDRIESIVIKNPFKFKFFYRILNKFYHILKLEDSSLSKYFLYKKILKYCKNEKYDSV